jgi:hypothetical protein
MLPSIQDPRAGAGDKDGRDIIDCMLTDISILEFGNEKSQSLEGLTDKQIEDTVSGLVSKA